MHQGRTWINPPYAPLLKYNSIGDDCMLHEAPEKVKVIMTGKLKGMAEQKRPKELKLLDGTKNKID